MPNLTDRRGRLTAYGLSCGYVRTWRNRHGADVRLWREHGTYLISADGRLLYGRGSRSLAKASKIASSVSKG